MKVRKRESLEGHYALHGMPLVQAFGLRLLAGVGIGDAVPEGFEVELACLPHVEQDKRPYDVLPARRIRYEVVTVGGDDRVVIDIGLQTRRAGEQMEHSIFAVKCHRGGGAEDYDFDRLEPLCQQWGLQVPLAPNTTPEAVGAGIASHFGMHGGC